MSLLVALCVDVGFFPEVWLMHSWCRKQERRRGTHKGKEREKGKICCKVDRVMHLKEQGDTHSRIACVAVIDERGVTSSSSTTPTRAP